MADLRTDTAGIKSPNPFWLASGPPTNTGDQVMRAFDLGWGGAVWKTLGEPIRNTTSRYGAIDYAGKKVMGFNNIELITDRPLEVNLREISEVKKRYPDHAVVASLMVETKEDWREIIKASEDAGADGLELNFGCPHGMCERGMGSAVGQEPRVLEEITGWVKEYATMPVLVKLTPNITNILEPARAAARGGADGVSLINTIKSVMGVDLENLVPRPYVDGKSTSGGYCGPAVKPIALHMITQIAQDPQVPLPISGIGGIANWEDAAEFIALGSSSVQVCTAAMHKGFRIVEDMIEGLDAYLDRKGMKSVTELQGKAVPNYSDWGNLNLNYKIVAAIDAGTCIGCQLCYVACWDTAHQCIHVGETKSSPWESQQPAVWEPAHHESIAQRVPWVDEDHCVGCNLCSLVCPVPGCITMKEIPYDQALTWNEYVAQQGNGGGC